MNSSINFDGKSDYNVFGYRWNFLAHITIH